MWEEKRSNILIVGIVSRLSYIIKDTLEIMSAYTDNIFLSQKSLMIIIFPNNSINFYHQFF